MRLRNLRLLVGLLIGFFICSVFANPSQAKLPLKLIAVQHKFDMPIKSNLKWVLSKPIATAENRYEVLSRSNKAKPVFRVSPGTYRVGVTYNNLTAYRTVKVEPGKSNYYLVIVSPGQLKLYARSLSSSKKIKRNLKWTVNNQEDHFKNKQEKATQLNDASPYLELAPGKYHVTVKHGKVIGQTSVEVHAGKTTEATIYLNPSYLQLAAVAMRGGLPLEENLKWWVSRLKKNTHGKYETYAYSEKPEPKFQLLPGSYRIAVSYGYAQAEAVIKLKAGETLRKSLNLNAGELDLRAIAKEGGKTVVGYLKWQLKAVEPKHSAQKILIKTESSKPSFALHAGTYDVTAHYGSAKKQFNVRVLAGEQVERVINFNAGILRLKAFIKARPKWIPLKNNVKWWVFPATEENNKQQLVELEHPNQKALVDSTDMRPTFVLPEGKYRVLVQYKKARLIRTFTISAGQDNLYFVDFKRSKLQAKGSRAAAKPSRKSNKKVVSKKKRYKKSRKRKK